MILERLFSDVSPEVVRILERTLDGHELSVADDAVVLLEARGTDLYALMKAADVARQEDRGDDVSFVICRNLNFTNVCYVGCSFCGFSRHREDADAYDHPMETLLEKVRDAVARGATEVCIQGGIHPAKDHDLPEQAPPGSLGRDHRGRARHRTAHDRDHHVRTSRDQRARGPPPGVDP
jgi:FO synthase